MSRTTRAPASIDTVRDSSDGIKRVNSSTPVQISRALRTSSNITYWARTLHRRRLRRSTTSFTSATDSITTIKLATRPPSSA